MKAQFVRYCALILLVIAVVLVFGYEQKWKLDKEQAAFWDIILKFIGGLVAAVGAWAAVQKYFHERSKDNDAALIEAHKPFRLKRQDVYYDLVALTARISNKSIGDPTRTKDESEFWRLFWGVVPLVADPEVGGAVNRFSELIYEDRDVDLRNLSMGLAMACRKSLGFDLP